jgi:hypothetical protein
MTTTSSPWSREAAPQATTPPYAPPPGAPVLPPPMSAMPPAGAPGPQGFRPSQPRRPWAWIALAVLLAVVVAAAVGSTVTYIAMRNNQAAPVSAPQTSSPSAPQLSQAEVDAAKQNLCQQFDVSVRGQEGQGGLRVEGNLNVPVVLRGVNSASAVQNALVPAVPPDVASAARKYISATLDQTTAVMGNPPASEVNRLTDIRNDAINSLLDACGLPR